MRHDIQNITSETIRSNGEIFTRAERLFGPGLSSDTFRRVHGGYNASAVHLGIDGFEVVAPSVPGSTEYRSFAVCRVCGMTNSAHAAGCAEAN